ncbi:MAG: hypothetical protein NVSMB44_19220 [Ktedonobacteraceae bacterium]
MSRLDELPRFLLGLSFRIRLGLAMLSALFFLLVFLLLPAAMRNPAILCVPLALNAWLFRIRGTLLCIAGMLLGLWALYAFEGGGLLLPAPIICFLFAEALTFVLVGLLVCGLRIALDHSDAALRETGNAYKDLQKSHQLRDQFIVNVSHELRTPLTSVSGYLDLLYEHGDFLDEQQRALFLQYAQEGCRELILQVNTVLEAMRLNADIHNMQREPLNVDQVVREVVDHMDPQLVRTHPTHLEIDERAMIYADHQGLRQVLRNLLSNAYKYAPCQTPVIVSATTMASEGASQARRICVSVLDSGPGVPPVEQERIFQKFVRLERDRAGAVYGTGLGLYISKQLVEKMGGQIWVESSGEAGAGSRFCFLLPAAPLSSRQL